jgi:peptidoglycan/xylan/chitin deacetylase (PgdA/CDA1 family)
MNFLHIIRNILIAVFSFIGIAYVSREWKRKGKPLVRILVFHDVPDPLWFESLIEVLTKRYYLLTPEMFASRSFQQERINVLLSFDDGYATWESVVLPILTRYNLKGLFFINSGLIDTAEDPPQTAVFMREYLQISPKKALTWEGVRTLQSNGHTIGSHSRGHLNLALLSPEALKVELTEDKKRIKEMTTSVPLDVAYPFGTQEHVNAHVKECAQSVGFVRGYTAMTGFVPLDEAFSIPRTCIPFDVSSRTLPWWVEGGYDVFDTIKSLCVR